jgi:lysyl-tRNA synthetase class 2
MWAQLIGVLIERRCVQPTFLFAHPQCMSPLARAHDSRAGVAERFELIVAGVELVNAYNELADPRAQRRALNVDEHGDKETAAAAPSVYCDALEYGLPPTAGWGMGIDRLVMLLTGAHFIKDVILFPLPKQINTDAAK